MIQSLNNFESQTLNLKIDAQPGNCWNDFSKWLTDEQVYHDTNDIVYVVQILEESIDWRMTSDSEVLKFSDGYSFEQVNKRGLTSCWHKAMS